MMSLSDIQNRLHRAIVVRAGGDLTFLSGSPQEAATRLDIHRRHFRQSLTRALEKTFPAVVSLVDQRFFAYCADAFIGAAPPVKPCLFEYGADLPAFLANFEPCVALPYLSHVARLEWDIHAVFHELGADDGAGSYWIAPGLRLFRSPFPVHRIWQIARGEVEGDVDLDGGQAWLAVFQDDDGDVSVEALAPAAFLFLDARRRGGPFAAALGAARAVEPRFRAESDIPAAIVRLLPTVTNKAAKDETNV